MPRLRAVLCFGGVLLASWLAAAPGRAPAAAPREDLLRSDAPEGNFGGGIVTALRSDPKTFNPAFAVDGGSKEVLGLMNADLIHINRSTQATEPALAKSWKVSADGRRYTLQLRRGIRFSDGQPLTADDVVFSFQVYLDEKLHSPQRDLLVVNGTPLQVHKLSEDAVEFSLAEPYAAAERLFDSISILPRHLLEAAYREGKFEGTWGVNTPVSEIAGLGAFRLKEYVPGQRVVLERNPYYWKMGAAGKRLPYLDQITYLFVPSEDAEVLRFQAGDTDILGRFSADNFSMLESKEQAAGYRVADLGPGLEYNFLFFNLNDASAQAAAETGRKQAWFRDVRFRQAVSEAIDRDAIVRLVYRGRGTALWGNVTPGNRRWVDANLPHPARSIADARKLLASAGFSWSGDGALLDQVGKPVEFTIITSSSNAPRRQMSTIIQDDLSQLGMHVNIVPIEFRSLLDRVFNTHDYEACLLALGTGDADPTAEMNVWPSSGSTHVWHLGETKPATPWEAQIDELMQKQEVTLKYAERKALFDRVQELIGQNLPVICLASPNILLAAKNTIGNFRPAILAPYATWNAEELYLRKPGNDSK